MKFQTTGAPHLPPATSVQGVMLKVMLALLPGIGAHVYFFGAGIIVQIVIAVVTALLAEFLMLRARGRPLAPFLSDLSAPVTAVLFCLCLPPLLPWWATVVGMAFAIVVAKHLYGGLGFNIFNPAMVGYVVVLIAFPRDATAWLPPIALAEQAPDLGTTLSAIFTGHLPPPLTWDAITQATPLDMIRTGAAQDIMITEIRSDPLFGDFGGRGWEWIANFYALGGIYLLLTRVISWHIPVAILGVVIFATLPVYLGDPDSNPFPLQHIFSGGLVLGAFFIATDPVSGAATTRGRLIFGAGVALITLIVRRWGGYPDGFAFAVLLMNMAVPLIDRYTKPRVFGHGQGDGPVNGAALRLAGVLALALLLVTGVYGLTRDRIAQQQRLAELRSLAEVLPPALYDNDPIEDRLLVLVPEALGHEEPRKVYRGRLNGAPSALAIQSTAPDGYNGVVDLLVGIRHNGELTGVRVTSHRETPGLGDAIDHRQSDWIDSLQGKSLVNPPADNWQVSRDGGDFDQITGATISSRAVIGAVRRTLEYYATHQQELFAPLADPEKDNG